MATTSIIVSEPAGASIKSPDAAQQFSLGHRVDGDYGGGFQYGKAGAAIAAGDWVVFDKDFTATLLTTANSPRNAKIAVARYAFASGQYGFFQVEGGVPGRTFAAVAAGVRLNTTTTGGAVDDDGAVGSKEIWGAFIPTAAAGATTNTEFHLSMPVVGQTL